MSKIGESDIWVKHAFWSCAPPLDDRYLVAIEAEIRAVLMTEPYARYGQRSDLNDDDATKVGSQEKSIFFISRPIGRLVGLS